MVTSPAKDDAGSSQNSLQKPIIAPSLLAADILNLDQEITEVEAGGADWHHIDVMDGHFVENLTFGLGLIRALKKKVSCLLDVHIMVLNPDAVAAMYLEAGADLLSFHLEATHHAHRLVELINRYNKKPGVALNPATPVEQVFPLLSELHHVLLMSVNPGFGGQSFIESTVSKCQKLYRELEKRGLHHRVLIQVDGGIGDTTITKMAKEGATSFVAGSAIYQKNDRKQAIKRLRELAFCHSIYPYS